MYHISRRALLVMAFLVFAGISSSLSVGIAQTTRTNTLSQLTNFSFTNTILTTITSQIVTYTTTTQTSNSTLQGTQTVVQPSLTTATSTYATLVSGTVTETVSVIVTSISTETTQLLANIWGVSLALVLLVGACVSFLVPKAHSRRPKGVVCSSCGNRNPPFVRGFCVKCGHPLGEE